ncbi:hypothetical protein [Curtobacterium sp. 'Ferrero']|uniref:hypothetical protein n=1 Tax=Curtobacterium sp. 'Ferrero' TaxID=2033654 RepID=UPI0011411E6A|nr:hypothetical protein [Curtobacterium sp. 'Ferrero']
MDCLAFSNLTDAEWEAIRSLPEVEAVSCGRATFAVDNAIARYFVWDLLIPIVIAGEGVILTDYEDAPSTVFPAQGSGRMEFICDRDHTTEPESDGHFYGFDVSEALAIEAGVYLPTMPQELPPAEPIVYHRSPLASVFDRLPHTGPARISKLDRPDANAHAEISEAMQQFPDFTRVKDKVRGYCLNPEQSEQKWKGFFQAGYDIREEGHVEILTALICSALNGEFPIRDARATADGRVQFTVPVALPTTDGGLVPLLTSWLGGGGVPLSLATAYRAAGFDELSGTAAIPADLCETTNWDALFAYVSAETLNHASRLDGEGYPFFYSTLWIEHADKRSRAFATWVRKNRRGFSGVFSRVAFGGRVTFVRFPEEGNQVSAARAAAQANHAQVLFQLAGIRAHASLVGL